MSSSVNSRTMLGHRVSGARDVSVFVPARLGRAGGVVQISPAFRASLFLREREHGEFGSVIRLRLQFPLTDRSSVTIDVVISVVLW